MSVLTTDRVRELLDIDGTTPAAILVVDATPKGQASKLCSVILDYGWCETSFGPELEDRMNAAAIALGLALDVPVVTSEQQEQTGG